MRLRAWLSLVAIPLGCGARAELPTPSAVTPALVCGLVPIHARAGRSALLAASTTEGSLGTLRWVLPDGAPATLTPGPQGTARFFTEVEGDYLVRVTSSRVELGGCAQLVRVRGTAPGAQCAEAIDATASTSTLLVATVRSASPVASRSWSLRAAPAGSARPSPVGERFAPDVVGDYVLRFEVVDEQGERDRCETLLRAHPGPGLRVEVWWDPPGRRCDDAEGAGCDRSDVDLHLLQRGGSGWGSASDCHFANCNAAAGSALAWGGPGDDDDPTLLRDDTEGHGPEVITVRRPADGVYSIGAHLFDSHGAGAQALVASVFCAGQAATLGPLTLPGAASEDLWIAAEVTIEGSRCTVAPRVATRALTRWNSVRGTDGG